MTRERTGNEIPKSGTIERASLTKRMEQHSFSDLCHCFWIPIFSSLRLLSFEELYKEENDLNGNNNSKQITVFPFRMFSGECSYNLYWYSDFQMPALRIETGTQQWMASAIPDSHTRV